MNNTLPAFTREEIHRLISRPSQSELRRQADGYLLLFCLALLALAASLLRQTLPLGLTPLNALLAALAAATLWVALRAGGSLFCLWRMRRLRGRPCRMMRYADWLDRLSRRRHRWVAYSLSGAPVERVPSYAIAACLFLLIALNTNAVYSAMPQPPQVVTTTEASAEEVCLRVTQILQQL